MTSRGLSFYNQALAELDNLVISQRVQNAPSVISEDDWHDAVEFQSNDETTVDQNPPTHAEETRERQELGEECSKLLGAPEREAKETIQKSNRLRESQKNEKRSYRSPQKGLARFNALMDDSTFTEAFLREMRLEKLRKKSIRIENSLDDSAGQFSGAIEIKARKIAVKQAIDATLAHWDPESMTLWTDGAFNEKRAVDRQDAAAIIELPKLGAEYRGVGYTIEAGYMASPVGPELFAIAEALRLTLNKISYRTAAAESSRLVKLRIFCDSTAAIYRVRDYHLLPKDQPREYESILGPIMKQSAVLSGLGCKVSLEWVPSKAKVNGNLRAHNLARRFVRASLLQVNMGQKIYGYPCRAWN